SYDRPQPRKTLDVLGSDGITHDHQPVDLGAVDVVEVGESFGLAPHDADLGTKNIALKAVVRDLALLRVEDGDRHRDFSPSNLCDCDRPANSGGANDRFEGGDAVQYLVSGDRVRALAFYCRGKAFELGGERIEALIFDDFGCERRMTAGGRRLR